MFTNREVATAIWLIPLSVFLLTHAPVRASLSKLLRTFGHPKIATCIGLMLIYTAVAVMFLQSIHIWHAGLIKDTIVWFCFTGFVMMLRFMTEPVEGNVFRAILRDTVTAVLLLEFLLNAYNFPLLGELFFVPVITIVAALNAFTEGREEYRSVLKFTNTILGAIGVVLLYLAVANALAHYRELGSPAKLQEFALPPLLSILFSPFIFGAVLYATYEQVFWRLGFGRDKSADVIRYAKLRVIRRFGLRLGALRSFLKENAFPLIRVRNRDDIDALLSSASSRAASSESQPTASAVIPPTPAGTAAPADSRAAIP